MYREILKVGLAAIANGQLLVVRKRGSTTFILPGGKPEAGERHLDTLSREIAEELGCGVALPCYAGRFSDAAADAPGGTRVVVMLYSGELVGTPSPSSEIEELAWLDLVGSSGLRLAPSISNQVVPFLRGVIDRTGGVPCAESSFK